MAASDDDNDPDDPGTGDPGPDDDGTGGDDTGAGDADWKPPTKADWDAVQESLRKARRDARAAKRAKPDIPAPGADGDGDKLDAEQVKADATAAADSKWKPLMVRAAARAAFTEAGLVLPKKNADTALARVLKLLDVDDLEISDDGTVDGLVEQVDEIRADFPELFTATGRSRAGRVDGADRGTGNGKARTASEIQAAALLGSLR